MKAWQAELADIRLKHPFMAQVTGSDLFALAAGVEQMKTKNQLNSETDGKIRILIEKIGPQVRLNQAQIFKNLQKADIDIAKSSPAQKLAAIAAMLSEILSLAQS